MPAKRPSHIIYAPNKYESPKKTKPAPSLWLAAFQLALTIGVIIGLIYGFLFIWQAIEEDLSKGTKFSVPMANGGVLHG